MKSKFLAGLILLSILAVAFAADLTYTTLVPQTGDSELVMRNKQAVAIGQIGQGCSYTRLATAATNAIATNVVLERVIVNTSGNVSTLTLYDVSSTATNTIAVATTTAQTTLHYGIRVPNTLRVAATGTTNADLTFVYR